LEKLGSFSQAAIQSGRRSYGLIGRMLIASPCSFVLLLNVLFDFSCSLFRGAICLEVRVYPLEGIVASAIFVQLKCGCSGCCRF
jgi:hypothetical protein